MSGPKRGGARASSRENREDPQPGSQKQAASREAGGGEADRSVRSWWRRARFGIPTVLGLAPRGFFIPYRYAGDIPARRGEAYPLIAQRLATREPAFRELLDWIEDAGPALRAIGQATQEGTQANAPRWDQSWFPRLDAAAAYTLVRRTAPRRIVEVGSGHSTRFLARAVADGGLSTAITAIDPAPRAELEGLPVTLLRTTLQQAPLALFSALGPGDMLLVDSSHILMPGSDLDLILSEILPRLPAGVLVQFHDIFLPDAYPERWGWRGYNEQQAIVPLLLGGDWEAVFASRYLATRRADWVAGSVLSDFPLPAGVYDSALWLRRR